MKMKCEIPCIKGSFKHVLSPPGMAKARETNPDEQWYINDHCIFVDDDNRLHWFGITNPYPENGSFYGPGTHRHIGHAVAEHPFGPWQEQEHAFQLPKETEENIGACFVERFSDGYLMIYGYNRGFNFGKSTDLNTWEKMTDIPVLDLGPGTRDPCILKHDDGTYSLYGTAVQDGLSAVVRATSKDLLNWQQEKPALLTDIKSPYGAMESPFVHQRNDDYYLFLNHSHRQYQETLVFHSHNPEYFDWTLPLCTIFAHAAEIFVWNNQTYITHCGIEDQHWRDTGEPYGLWLAELVSCQP